MARTVKLKFDKSVDSGPLPEDADVQTRETIQKERVRRQIQAGIYSRAPGGIARKKKRTQIAATRAGY